MKILLREYNGKHYVYKDAKYTKNGFEVDKNQIHETNIVTILKDNRNKKYEKCSVCGEIFPKGSAKWEKHIEPLQDASRCIGCQHMRKGTEYLQDVKYKLLPNGNYAITSKSEAKLICRRAYTYIGYADINHEDARHNCIYNRCRNAERIPFTDFFTEYPGAFDDMITIDAILKNGYTNKNTYYNKYTRYKLKAKNSIEAHVNKLNIVDYFEVSYRYSYYKVFYSKKYDRLYVINNGKYIQWNPSTYDWPREVQNRVKEKIRSLYE